MTASHPQYFIVIDSISPHSNSQLLTAIHCDEPNTGFEPRLISAHFFARWSGWRLRWIQKKPFLIQHCIRNGFLFVFKSCHFLQQILLVIVQLYKIVGFSQKVLAKKKKQYNMYNDIDQSSRINLSLRIY